MPIYEIKCNQCRYTGETLVLDRSAGLLCPQCGAQDVQKLMSATSSLTGHSPQSYPGPMDSACCGDHPPAGGCAGPGSCCGKG
jgi:putative FmdB family regulatory protein